MAKVEIEIPEGKVVEVTKSEDGVLITFKEETLFDRLKTERDVYDYIKDLNEDWAQELCAEFECTPFASYSGNIALYRMVVAALTNNEKRSLITGECWYPVVEFGNYSNTEQYQGNNIVGKIESEGKLFTVISGSVYRGAHAGLGGFSALLAIGLSHSYIDFLSVSRKDVAEHISKYFGRLLFEVTYGGTNCDWNWVD